MKIKLKNKSKPITQMWCFLNGGYCSTIISELNSGNEVKVDKIPSKAKDFVSEVKKTKKKGDK
tara:strand:- start:898 stop:1086 length:189 start_codon:yes stop_codon:yes gene_type:complete